MKNILRGFIFFCSGALLFAQPVLRLKVHAPNAGEAPDPASRTVRPPNARIHVIVQFDDPPSAETLAALTARGMAVLQDVPDNAVLVAMDRMTPLDDLGIRVAAQLDPAEKISPMITGADASQASEYYLVEFHPDVEPNAARRLLLSSDVEMLENPDLARNQFLIHIPPGLRAKVLIPLSMQDPVAYIFPASDELIERLQTFPCGGILSANGTLGQYVASNGDGWDGPGLNDTELFYFFSQMTAQLASGAPQAEILRAMAEWSDVIQLHWLPGSSAGGARTVNIQFAQGAHGDGYPFDGPGTVLAHTFYPAPLNPEPLAGDMHLDDAESWRIGANIDLFSVALHELGHALGLGHSDDPRAVMYPYYKMVSALTDEDKTAIATMYATRSGALPPPPPAPLALSVNVPAATTTLTTISLSGTVTGGSGAPAITWSSSAGASGTAALTATNWGAQGIPLVIGINTITVRATDATGSVSQTVSVTRQDVTTPPPPPPPAPVPPTGTDKTGPTLVISYPPATFSTSLASLTFKGTASDPSGVASVTWSTSTGKAGTASGTVQWSAAIPLLAGSNQVIIRSTDTAGNMSWRSVVVTRR